VNDDRDELLARIPVAEVLEEIGGPPKGRAWPCPNPTHAQTGRTPPVSIDPTGRLFNCHGCGAAGTAIDALVLGHDVTVAEAFALLRDRTGLDRRPAPAPRPQHGAAVLGHNMARNSPPADAADLLARFVEGRGWRPDVAEMFRLTVVTDRWGKPRVRFPYHQDGQLIWHQDRQLGGAGPKYLNPDGQPQQPYALDLAGAIETAQDVGEAWLVEGPPDVVALGHLADPGKAPAVIGLPGTTFAGLARLARALTGLTVAVVADADDAGEKMRTTVAEHLTAAGAQPVQVRLPAGINDLDDLRRHHGSDDRAFQHAVVTARHGPRWADLLNEAAA